ncbi:helix-turn-helix domain-containing protein [Enterococcus sp. AZ196]|uniref:helix-turn-helix domain-containing protein n=1 Tax=Enterococcus sp. AZ196 TaxID=2774659 RepID=UPI003D2A02C3
MITLLDNLLAKEEWRKYQLLKRLERSSYFALSKKEIMDHLEISNYVLKSTIEQLIQDLEKYGLTQEIHVYLEEPFVQLEITGTASSETLLEKYVEESIGFNILSGAVLGKYKSLNELSEKAVISYPIAYNNYKLLNEYLTGYGLKIDKKFRLVGDSEKNVRLFLTELFVRIYKCNYVIFGQTKGSLVQAKQAALEKTKMTVHQKTALEHYLYVTDLRIRQQKYVEKDVKNVLAMEDVRQAMSDRFFERVPVEAREAEARAFLNYYYSCSEELGRKLTLQENKQIVNWSQNLLSSLIEGFPKLTRIPEKYERFLEQSHFLHFQLLETSQASETIQPEINIAYFQQNYPAVLDFCRIYIARLQQNEPKLFNKKKQLLFQYLFLILETFSKDALVETINVYVDFSLGSLYNQFITDNLNFFHLVGTRIVTDIESADILLTDSREMGRAYNLDCVVWLSPPRPLDWANLGQRIIQKRNEKTKEA